MLLDTVEAVGEMKGGVDLLDDKFKLRCQR